MPRATFLFVLLLAAPLLAVAEDCGGFSVPPSCRPKHATARKATKHTTAGPIVSQGSCQTLNFEGIANLADVNPSLVGTVFRTSGTFLAIVDGDAGGSGNFANEKSPDTVGFTLGDIPLSVNFTQGCAGTELWFVQSFTATNGLVFEYYDMSGNLLANRTRTEDGFRKSTGDPNGDYDTWFPEVYNSFTNKIGAIVIKGGLNNQAGFDDIKCCVNAEDVVVDGPCTSEYSETCTQASLTTTKKQACLSFNDDDVCGAPTTSGDC